MKKYFFFFLVLINTTLLSQNSGNFEFVYNKLMDNLSSENWNEANKICSSLLEKFGNNQNMEKENSVLKYILIYTNAGLLNAKVISKEEALKRVENLVGSYLSMPAHPFNVGCYVNCTSLVSDKKNTLFSGVNNSKGTQIFCFEYVTMKENLSETFVEQFRNKNIALSGKLKEIKVEGNIFPRYKLTFDEGTYEIVE